MTNLATLPSKAVEISGSRTFTTSLMVADVFGKQHKNVLRDIDELDCSHDFHRLNFEPMVRREEIGSGALREFRFFEMTKDGFTFLVMGYTGTKAAQFKEAYINRFNEMASRAVNVSSSQSLDFIAERLERIERAVSALAPAAALSLPPAATKNLGSAECLDLILASEVPVTGEQWRGDASVRELIGVVCGRPSRGIPERDSVRTLARYGLRIDDGMLLISNTNKQLRQLLARTRWAGAWRLALSGIAGARKIPKTVFIGGHGSRCVAVPIPSGGGDGSG